jgi:hypothetical protein
MTQTRYRWMLFIVLVLLISNIVLAFLLTGSNAKKKEDKKKPEDRVSAWYKEVGLEQSQIDTFKLMKEDYFKVMKPIWGEIRMLKDSLYSQLSKSPEDSVVNSLLIAISQKNLASDKHTFTHFSKLRRMCTLDQQARFDTIIPKMLNRPWSRSKK